MKFLLYCVIFIAFFLIDESKSANCTARIEWCNKNIYQDSVPCRLCFCIRETCSITQLKAKDGGNCTNGTYCFMCKGCNKAGQGDSQFSASSPIKISFFVIVISIFVMLL